MSDLNDTYKTIEKPFVGDIYKAKGSKFIGYTFPILKESDVTNYINQLKSEHHKARHWCYAWQLGAEKIRFRANDDGEPNNSAGQPIYGQILSKGLTNILIVVVRYFGGTKLGVGGLITAYKKSAQLAIEASIIATKTINIDFGITFEYKDLNKVMRIIKEYQIEIRSQKMEFNCDFEISIRKSNSKKAIQALENLRCVKINDI
jgi:uncharacterized YigZ family protein